MKDETAAIPLIRTKLRWVLGFQKPHASGAAAVERRLLTGRGFAFFHNYGMIIWLN